MKIGVDIRCLMNPRYTGVSWYAFNLLENIFRLDSSNEYRLFCNSSKKIALPEFDYPNVRHFRFRYPNKIFNLCLNFFSWPKIDRMLGGADFLIAPNLHFMAWSENCRKIMVVHDLSFLRFKEFFSLKMRLWHKLILRKNILNQADIIVADSLSTKRDLTELLKIKPEKIQVIYPGVSPDFRVIPQEELLKVKQKYDLPAEFVLSLGALEPRKNVLSAIQACGRPLVIAGPAGWKTDLMKKRNVRFLGYVAEKDKPYLYNLASVFVYPSYYEGFGLPLLEAMACGVPVVAGLNSSQGEVVGKSGLLVDPYNLNEIRQAIETILTDDGLRQDLIRSGLSRAREFSWEKTAEQFLKLYENRS